MRLHGHMRIQMVEGAVSFLASLMPAFVHALDLFVATAGAFVLLRSGNRHEGIHLGEWVRWTLRTPVSKTHEQGQHSILDRDAEVQP